MPKVSVIIPTHNRAELLGKAVQSILDQTFTDFELLVCDDASTDNTPELIKRFEDKRILYTRYETNRGVIEVRNNAITNSKGKYIEFLDDDDEWIPTKLEKQVALLDRSPDKLGVVYTGASSTDMELGRIIKVFTPRYRGNILKDLLKGNFLNTSTIVLRKLCFEKLGLFDPRFGYAEDFDMWIRIAEVFDYDYIKESLVKHRVNRVSLSTNYGSVTRGLENLFVKHRELFESDDKALGVHFFKLGIAYCYYGDTKLGRSNILKAIKLNPFDIKLYYNLFISSLGPNIFKFLKDSKKSFISLAKPQNQVERH